MDRARDANDYSGDPVFHVELQLHGSAPRGHVTGADGTSRAFTGWMGLMSAVDTLSAKGERQMSKEDGQ